MTSWRAEVGGDSSHITLNRVGGLLNDLTLRNDGLLTSASQKVSSEKRKSDISEKFHTGWRSFRIPVWSLTWKSVETFERKLNQARVNNYLLFTVRHILCNSPPNSVPLLITKHFCAIILLTSASLVKRADSFLCNVLLKLADFLFEQKIIIFQYLLFNNRR